MVFEVVPKLSYDAMREWRREAKAVKARNENPNYDLGDQNDVQQMMLQQKRWETLEKRVKQNNENNSKYRKLTYGRKVMYGQPI